MIVGQVALTVALLAGAGLMLRSYYNLEELWAPAAPRRRVPAAA